MKILVTGTNSGFGKLIVETLLAKGHSVVASMRDIDGKNKAAAEELTKKGAEVVEIDVTDDTSVEAGVAKAVELTGGLDVVVNNAGVGIIGLQEGFTADDWKKLFDVNVFGVARVNRAALPHLREKGEGLLLHISSILGRMVFPFYGPYNASKWALEALSENYRVELSGFGIESCIIEPGGYMTAFFENLGQPSDAARLDGYGEMKEAPKKTAESFSEALSKQPEQKPQLVADAVLKVIESPAGERPIRTVVDKMGMGDALAPYNEALEQLHQGIYNAFGMGDMLKTKVKV